MSNERQWFMVKVMGALFLLFSLISTAVGVANMHYGLQRRVVVVEDAQVDHVRGDEKKWDNIFVDVDDNKDAITLLQIQSARQETQYQEIMRVLQELKATIDRLEYAGIE